MTKLSSKSISPDSITGMIFAAEGIKNVIVLLNGPMGCKFYHSTTSAFLTKHSPLRDAAGRSAEKGQVEYDILNNWFFRQPRVPCTWLDGDDYVYGTAEKAEAAMRYFGEKFRFDLLVIVDSPGASLIGDELKELAARVLPGKPTAVLESPGYSEHYADGYDRAAAEILRQLPDRFSPGPKPGAQPRVNLLGLSVWQRYWDGDKAELTRLLEACGIRVGCCLCADSTVEDIFSLPEADLNLLLYPEMGRETAALLEKRFGTPCLTLDGPPVGFAATEEMIRAVCARLDVSPDPVLEESERKRAECWFKLRGLDQQNFLSSRLAFAVEGPDSAVWAYTRFLTDYLGMTPDCVSLNGSPVPECREKLRALLRSLGAGDAETKDILDTSAELVYADANTIAALMTRNDAFSGIEISLPGMGYVDIVPKTHLGLTGTQFLTEQTVNGLMSRI